MKIAIVVGGGGHFAPALPIIQELKKNNTVLVLGRKYSLEGDSAISFEYQTAQELKIPFQVIATGRLQRKLTRYTFLSFFKLPVGFFQSFKVLMSFNPDVLFSTGGYVCLPATFAAFFLGIPIVIHEQTLAAGLSNRISSFFAKKICISWLSSKKYFPENKTILTGNPIKHFPEVKKRITEEFDLSNEKLPILYITGGSTGSHRINALVGETLNTLLEHFRIIHQTGDSKKYHDYDDLNKKRSTLTQKLQSRYCVVKFIAPTFIETVLQYSSLVVSRSGINTVTELLYFNKPSLLIPLPFSQGNEQMQNARFLKQLGLGEILIQDGSLNAHNFLSKIEQMYREKKNYTIKQEGNLNLSQGNASDKVIEVIIDASKKQKKN